MSRSSGSEMILIFHGTHEVLSVEKRLKAGGVPMRLIPVPRQLTSDCGLAIRVPLKERGRVREILSAAALSPKSVHFARRDGSFEAGTLSPGDPREKD
jgi:Putative Se/S carrier protein-like